MYKIFLSRLIGATAIGLYQMVSPFLALMIALSTAGIPTGVSKLVAREKSLNNTNGVYKVLLIALFLGGTSSLVLSIFVSFKIDCIVNNILKNPVLYYPVLWTIPAISLITFSSILRGFFYGLKEMSTPAIAQIIEQVFRIGFVLFLLYYKPPSNIVSAATIAIIGVSLGEFFGLFFLTLRFNFKKLKNTPIFLKTHKNSSTGILKDLLYISLPLTLSHIISVIMQTINSILIPQRLQLAGYSAITSIEVFGKISGMAMPLLFLPFTVTNALVTNIIPNISEELAVKNWDDINSKSSLALKMTLLIAIPTTVAYTIFGKHIGELIYNQGDIGIYLSILSYGTIFHCMQHTLSGILYGMGKQVMTSINSIIGMLVQLGCTYFLMANPLYGINGYFIGFILSSFITFILHLMTLLHYSRLDLPLMNSIIKPSFASICMVVAMIYSYKVYFNISSSNPWSSIVSLFIGGLTYLLLLMITKTFDLKHFIVSVKK